MTEQMISSRLPNGAMGMRVQPKMAPTAYRSFEVHSPIETHWRDATCKEMECQHYLAGWVSRFDVSTPQGKQWAYAVRRSGRRYSWEQSGSIVTFRFGPGQACFQSPHKVEVGRPELYIVRDGDWRGNPTGRKDRVKQPLEFVERMAENLDALDSAIRRG